MDSQDVDNYFLGEVGPVWRELRGGLWHSTGSHRFREILSTGEIQPTPHLPLSEFRWAEQGTTYCRSIDGVSLFDFAEADWSWIFEKSIQHYWVPFLKAPGAITPPDRWVSTVWLLLDRSKLTGFAHWKEIQTAWRRDGPERKWIPRLEACHKGSIPLSACTHVLIVCAVNEREFHRMPLHPFDLGALDRMETDWRNRFAEPYSDRALSIDERVLSGIKRLKQLPDSYKSPSDLEERLRDANRRVEQLRKTQRESDE